MTPLDELLRLTRERDHRPAEYFLWGMCAGILFCWMVYAIT